MPPRSFVWAIFVFWLATAGWLFQRALLPRLRPENRPQFFRFQHADEVRPSNARWQIYRDHQKIGSALPNQQQIGSGESAVHRLKHGFRLSCELKFREQDQQLVILDLSSAAFLPLPFKKVKLTELKSAFDVTVKGELRAMTAEALMPLDDGNQQITFSLSGKVREGVFTSAFRVTGLGGLPGKPITLEPVDVAPGECFINPMHPLDKIWDLREGQHWRMPLSDPLAEAVRGMLAKWPVVKELLPRTAAYYDADVTSRVLRWSKGDYDCWVIDYREPGQSQVVARTWVRKSDNSVLRQEAAQHGSRLVMDRMPLGSI
jgi:hypothetical protein